MLFTDTIFLIFFLPTLIGVYFVSGGGRRRFGIANGVIVVGSISFYAAADRAFAEALFTATITLFALGRAIEIARHADTQAKRDTLNALPEICFAVGLTGILLFYIVYTVPNSIVGSTHHWLSAFGDHRFSAVGLLAPLGLSVFVCHAVSFIIDVYRQDAAVHNNPVHTVMYLLGFPFMVAGPIVPFREVSQYLIDRQVGMASFAYGIRRFTIGLCKVVLIEQTLSIPVDAAFTGTDSLNVWHAWIGLACLSLQVYYDLSGYADMAIGISRMLGFRLPENFNLPYTADTLNEFWERWNISLNVWCRAYFTPTLDPPSNHPSAFSWSLVIFFVSVVLWHGGSTGVLIWGAIHGVFVVLERTRWGVTLTRVPAPVRHVYLLLFISLSWVFFRAESITDALYFFKALGGFGSAPTDALPIPMMPSVWFALIVGIVASVPVPPTMSRWSVTVDAMATALQMIVTTAAMFLWVRVFGQRQMQNDMTVDDEKSVRPKKNEVLRD